MDKINLINLQRGARHRLAVIGVPHSIINPFTDLCFKWASCNGPEWTVKRLKSLKIDLIRSFSGLPYITTWVRKNSHGEYYGVIGSLFRWCEESGSPQKARKRFSKVLNALNIYTTWTSPELTKTQIKKFLDGVQSDPYVNLDWEFYSKFLEDVRINIGRRSVQRGGNSLIEYRGSPNKWAPVPFSDKRVHQDRDILREIEWLNHPENYQFAWKHYELYAPVLSCIAGPLDYRPITVNADEYLVGGEVHFLQEPGFKLRAIASPYRIHQLALKPLGDAIYSIVQDLPWDCTFDQSKAVPMVQAALRRGVKVSSIDLTGATDYFPLEIQSMVLREIFGDLPDITLFEEVSKMRWKSQIGYLEWSRGQPLGLYPSFGSFTLAHGLVLLHLSGGIYKSNFFVVGDDVVILDQDLASKYLKFLEIIGCPWSPEKTITSNSLCEFVGKVITVDQVIPSYKWRELSNDNFLDICRNLGYRSRELLSTRQRRVFDLVKGLIRPFGLEFNEQGKDLAQRYLETDRILRLIEQTVLGSLTDLNGLIHRNLYGCSRPYSLNHDVIRSIRQTFDLKVCTVYTKTVVSRLTGLYSAFEDIPRALDILPRLPPKIVRPSRLTTLQRYEGLLQAAGLL